MDFIEVYRYIVDIVVDVVVQGATQARKQSESTIHGISNKMDL